MYLKNNARENCEAETDFDFDPTDPSSTTYIFYKSFRSACIVYNSLCVHGPLVFFGHKKTGSGFKKMAYQHWTFKHVEFFVGDVYYLQWKIFFIGLLNIPHNRNVL